MAVAGLRLVVMTTEDDPLLVRLELTLSNAKRAQRETRAVVQGLAQIRDHLIDNNATAQEAQAHGNN